MILASVQESYFTVPSVDRSRGTECIREKLFGRVGRPSTSHFSGHEDDPIPVLSQHGRSHDNLIGGFELVHISELRQLAGGHEIGTFRFQSQNLSLLVDRSFVLPHVVRHGVDPGSHVLFPGRVMTDCLDAGHGRAHDVALHFVDDPETAQHPSLHGPSALHQRLIRPHRTFGECFPIPEFTKYK